MMDPDDDRLGCRSPAEGAASGTATNRPHSNRWQLGILMCLLGMRGPGSIRVESHHG